MGIARNELIARSKIILNIHFYLSGILETPRVSYAVANKKFIISENSNPEDEIEWRELYLLRMKNNRKYNKIYRVTRRTEKISGNSI